MARISLDIVDGANRLMLGALLTRAGHTLSAREPELLITDDPRNLAALSCPRLLLTPVNGVPEAVLAMRKGLFGYILLPLQPGEAELMVERALEAAVPAGQPVAKVGAPALQPLAEVEADHIRRVLRHCRNNQAEAARLLGIGRNTLWRKLKKLEAEAEAAKSRPPS